MRYLLFAFAFSVPLIDMSRYYLGTGSLTEILLLIIVAICFARVMTGHYKLTITPVTMLLLLFFIICLISWLQSQADTRNIKDIIRVLEYVIIYIVISILAYKESCRQSFFWGLFAGGIAAICLALIHFYMGPQSLFLAWGPEWAESYTRDNFRVYGSFSNPLNLVGYISTLGALSISIMRKSKSIYNRVFHFLMLTSIFVTLIITGSRSSLLLGLVLILINRDIKLIVLASIMLPLSINFLSQISTISGLERVLSIINNLNEGNSLDLQRQYVWHSAWQMIINNPFIGVGLGNFANAYETSYMSSYASNQTNTFTAENMFLEIGAEVGLLGLVIMLFLILRTIYLGYKYDDLYKNKEVISLKDIAICILAYTLIGMIQSMSAASLNIFLFSLMGVQDSILRSQENKKSFTSRN